MKKTKQGDTEKSYQQRYCRLFNGITDAIEAICQQNFGLAKEILISAQQTTEGLYINMEKTDTQENGNNECQDDGE